MTHLGRWVESVRQSTAGKLPVDDSATDLSLNRHGELDLAAAARVLEHGGSSVSAGREEQQVGDLTRITSCGARWAKVMRDGRRGAR